MSRQEQSEPSHNLDMKHCLLIILIAICLVTAEEGILNSIFNHNKTRGVLDLCRKDLGSCSLAEDCKHRMCSMRLSCDGTKQEETPATNNCVCHDGICMNHGDRPM